MQRTLIKDTLDSIDSKVRLIGFVSVVRDMGKMVFIELRDRTGKIQCTLLSDAEKKLIKTARTVKDEWVLGIEGKVVKRPEKMVNPDLITGTIELMVESLEVINESKTPPFPLDTDGHDITEELRMKHRYLDMRRPRMRKNMIVRAKFFQMIRELMSEKEFVEIDTPILTKGTPEGAREYIVPSRNHAGSFYVLPQSPQQFKQLLMVAGFEKYFQIARCFRDEDVRADRHQEFIQLDMEMSFVNREDVMQTTENIFTTLLDRIMNYKGSDTDAPEWIDFTKTPFKLQSKEFPVLTYKEAMEKFETDKPDLRSNKEDPHELAFCWIIDFPLFEEEERDGKLVSEHHPFTSPHPEDIDRLESDPHSVRSLSYDLVLNGYEVGGGSIRIHEGDLQRKVFSLLGISEEEQEAKFGHLLTAFEYGVPPHGGIAPGLGRILMALLNETSIREVIPFPKTGDGRDALMGAPAPLPTNRLKEANIAVKK